MKQLILLCVCALLLGACTTIQTGAGKAGTYLCARKDSLRVSALTTIQNAGLIEDPVIRGITVAGAQGILAALESCPPTEVVTPPGVVGG